MNTTSATLRAKCLFTAPCNSDIGRAAESNSQLWSKIRPTRISGDGGNWVVSSI